MFSFGVFKKVGGLSENSLSVQSRIEDVASRIGVLNSYEITRSFIYEEIKSLFGSSSGKMLFSKDFLLGLSNAFSTYLSIIKDKNVEKKTVLISLYLNKLLEELIHYEQEIGTNQSSEKITTEIL